MDFLNGTYNNSTNTNDSTIAVNTITIILSVIFILGVFFNIISFSTIVITKNFQPINILIMNLAFADIVYISGIPLFVLNSFYQSWPLDLIGCRIFFFTDFVGTLVGVYTVTALSVERFIEVTDKKKKLENVSDTFKVLIISIYMGVIWFLALLFSIPMVMSIKAEKSLDDSYTCDTYWTVYQLNLFFFIKFVFSFIVPLIIILFSSTKLLIFLKKWKKNSSNKSSNETSVLTRNKSKKIKNPMRDKAIRIVLSIVLLFIVQWVPLWVVELYKALPTNDYIENIQLINMVVTLISYSNSITNPLLYIFLTVNFRKRLTDICQTRVIKR